MVKNSRTVSNSAAARLFAPIMFFLISSSTVLAQQITDRRDYVIEEITEPSGDILVGIRIPGNPPPSYRLPAATVKAGSIIIQNVPAYDWSFGCGATSGAMLAGYYDRNGYPNVYIGPTNSGIAPLDNSVWGSVVINGEPRKQCPLSATRLGLDGRTERGHVDNYWVKSNSTAPDPYITNGWPQHAWGDCVGDYMKTSQSAYNNEDGSSSFWYYLSGERNFGTINTNDCVLGLRNFFEARGYKVVTSFTQYISGLSGNTLGFTFNNLKEQIDAGRPVLLFITGHIMLGIGYNDSSRLIYLYDTWDYKLHEMPWAGKYDNRQLEAVGVIELESANLPAPSSFTVSNVGDGASLSWEAPDLTQFSSVQINQGFEDDLFPPAGWIKLNPDGGPGWQSIAKGSAINGWLDRVSTAAPDGGSRMVYCTYTTGGTYKNDQWLISPQIIVRPELRLMFHLRADAASIFADKVEVLLSTSHPFSTSAFSTTIGVIQINKGSSETWRSFSYTLTDYAPAGSKIYIAFREVAANNFDEGCIIYMDNIYVGPPKSTSLFKAEEEQVRSSSGTRSASFERIVVPELPPYSAEDVGEGPFSPSTEGTFSSTTQIKSLFLPGNTLHTNGSIVNSQGTGDAGKADESIVQSQYFLMANTGFSANKADNFSLADDFVVNATWDINNIEFFAYQTGSSLSSTITAVYVQIWRGAPNSGGTIVWGNHTTNRLLATSWAYIYRNTDGPNGSKNRPVMRVVAETSGLLLTPGTYWVHVTFTGSLASGPWVPPITINGLTVTGNALQYRTTWNTLQDAGTNTQQGIPFNIYGTSTSLPANILLSGYALYRNDVLYKNVPANGTSFADNPLSPGNYKYSISALYEKPFKGESGKLEKSVTVTAHCNNCPGFDFTITPVVTWQGHTSSVAASGCRIYRVNVVAAQRYSFKTGCGNGAMATFDTKFDLYNADCELLVSNDNACENNRSSIDWKSSYAGYAYLKVSGSSNSSGDYTLAYRSNPIFGDANCDAIVNVSDLINMVNFIMGNPPQQFCFPNADINGDGIISVLDIVSAVNIIMSN